jgi:hypothetical protein
MDLSYDPEMIFDLSLVKDTQITYLVWSKNYLIIEPVVAFHKMTVQSNEPVSINLLSLLISTELINVLWPYKVFII